VPALKFQFRESGIYFPDLRLWLDPHWPKEELVFVSHAHSDHTADHREVILSEPTARLMSARMGGKRIEHALPFNQPQAFQRGGNEFRITLIPAGHIFGSAMSLIECAGESLLFTGDFKLRRGLSAETCQPVRADTLIMETTYGRPQYRFPPTEDVMRGVVRFCKEALDNDETAVLYGYSLGKSQEMLCALADAGLPIVLHGTVFNMTKVYEQFGHCFPAYEKYEAGKAQGKVLLCPPNVAGSAMLRNLGKTRCAVLTGWAVDPGCKYQYRCDAAFPLSDHADFPDLIEFVKQVQPKHVHTLHGFAGDFAATLRGLGFEAGALSEDEQMMLGLNVQSPRSNAQSQRVVGVVPGDERRQDTRDVLPSASDSRPSMHFVRFAETCAAIGGTPSKLEKTRLLAEYLQSVERECVPLVTIWFTGLPFAPGENRVLQVGWALLRDALCAIARVDENEFHHVYLKHSDLGETASELFERMDRSRNEAATRRGILSLSEVHALFEALQSARGPTAKLPLLIDTFTRCSPLEIKFLVKIITSDLRIGLKEGLVEEAVARAFNVLVDEVRNANLLLGNIGETARLASENRLREATIQPFRPVKFMLASPEETAADIWERLIASRGSRGNEALTEKAKIDQSFLTSAATVWLEDKYDGVRCQLHKVGSRVALYSRDLKDITTTFHDVADGARSLSSDVILDGEILAMRGEEVLSFAELQKRLGRREHDLFLREEVPIQFIAFDLLWLNGTGRLNEPLHERREQLEQVVSASGLRLARITQASSAAEIEAVFLAARDRNNEGLIAKDPESIYSPGRRGLAWLKLKKALATLDCVVVGAEYGHGKRSKVLSDYTFAVRDERTGELKTIGKAYSGLTDAEIAELTQHFLSRTVEKHGRFHVVAPDTVLEIAFDRIQESDRHSSGLAMRFPRIVRVRADKSPRDIDTLTTARKLVAR
jgi:DNA ligase 1